MLKKLFLFALATCTLAACNKDEGTGLPYDYVYLKENTNISEGHLQGSNMHFYGTSTVTDATGGVFTYRKAHFELAGLDDFHTCTRRASPRICRASRCAFPTYRTHRPETSR